eukprot:365661-Chlamydomonas_euryale.AAC.41
MKAGLADCPNAVIVPHIASASFWTRSGMVRQVCMCVRICACACPCVPWKPSFIFGGTGWIAGFNFQPGVLHAQHLHVCWGKCASAVQSPLMIAALTAIMMVWSDVARLPPGLCLQATLAAANVAATLQGFPVWANPNNITPFIEKPLSALPAAAPSLVNAKELNLPVAAAE